MREVSEQVRGFLLRQALLTRLLSVLEAVAAEVQRPVVVLHFLLLHPLAADLAALHIILRTLVAQAVLAAAGTATQVRLAVRVIPRQ